MCEDVSRLHKGYITEDSFRMFIEKHYYFCKNNKLPPKKVVISQDIYSIFIEYGFISPNPVNPINHIQGIPYEVLEDSNVENYIKFE